MITHNFVEGVLDNFMEEKGWIKVRVKALPEQFNHRPDRIFCWPWPVNKKLPLFMEVKPEKITAQELEKGIGQCVYFLKYQVKSYYVIHEKYYESIERSILQIPVGVILYKSIGEEPQIILARSAPDRDTSGLISLDADLIRVDQKLVKGLLLSFLIENYLIGGWYSLDEIVAKMADAFPLFNILRPVIGHMLTAASFAKRYREGILHYHISGDWQHFRGDA